jgi:hypothetical protein
MKTYIFNVEQVIEIKAGSLEEAQDSLPVYETGFEGQKYYVKEETIELLKKEEDK